MSATTGRTAKGAGGNDRLSEGPNDELSEFGYAAELKRSMGSYSSFALAFSMISVVTTVFTLFAQPFQTLGGVAIWLWLPVIAGVLLMAAVYGHLAVRLPITGYAYHWSSRLINRHYGWFTGYNAMLCQFIGSAGIATAFASVFAPAIWPDAGRGHIVALACLALLAAVIINIISIALTSRINNVGASFELIGGTALTVVLGIGLFFFAQRQGVHVLGQVGSSTHDPITLTSVATAFLLPVWTLAGWEGSADLAEETHDPRASAPKAMMRSVAVSGLAGFAMFAVFAMAIPGDVATIVNGTAQNPMVAIFASHFGDVGSAVVQVIVFAAMFSCLLANVTVATRTCYSLSRDNMLPGSSLWKRVNRTTRTPIAAVVLVAVFAAGVNLLSAGIATQVTGMVSVVLYVTYGLTLIGALVGHRRGRIPPAPARYFGLAPRTLTVLCVIGIIWAVVIVACMTVPGSDHVVAMYMIGFEVAGALWYVFGLRRRLLTGRAGPRLEAPRTAAEADTVVPG